MIRYALKCTNDHSFDSWFPSADAYDTQNAAGLIACPVCNSDKVAKSVMAPRIKTGGPEAVPADPHPDSVTAATPGGDKSAKSPGGGALSAPASQAERMMSELRRRVESSTEDVGDRFANVARQMHDGEVEAKPIRGRTSLDEAQKLMEDGVPVLPLPFGPRRTN